VILQGLKCTVLPIRIYLGRQEGREKGLSVKMNLSSRGRGRRHVSKASPGKNVRTSLKNKLKDE
jgi:hypothetical protein